MPDARSRSSWTAACALANALSTSSARTARVGVEALARELQLDHQRHKPLLRAVVQVAPQAPSFRVARLDQPRPRRAQRLQPRAQLDFQPRVLERERGGGARLDHQLRCLAQHGGVQQRADAPALVVDLRQLAARAGRRQRMPLAVDVAALGQPVGQIERRVAERVRQRVADVAIARELLDQPRDRGGAEETGAQQARAGTPPETAQTRR